MRRGRGLEFAVFAALVWLVPATAAANGNVSHLWVTLWAVDELPDGDLKDLLTGDDVDLMLRNGANFPDGGYAVGDGYGEIAHWEPFQTAYMDWIIDHHQPPWSAEAAQHIAFLMGMASHGMCDQVYDGTYLTRSQVHDEGSPGSTIGLDGSSDVCLAAGAGPLEAPEVWVPDELMAQLMTEQMGHAVDASTIHDGQSLVGFSLYYVSTASQDPDQVAEHREAYPWACDHQMDTSIPGSPPVTAPVVAAYWLRLWERLNGRDPLDSPLIAQFPAAGPSGHPTGAGDVDAMVSFVVARGLDSGTVGTDVITVSDDQGAHQTVDVSLYYGGNSHVINLLPVDGWGEATPHQVTAGPGLRTWDGLDVDPISFEFDTSNPSQDDGTEDGCACAVTGSPPSSAAAWLLLPWALVSVRRHGRGSGPVGAPVARPVCRAHSSTSSACLPVLAGSQICTILPWVSTRYVTRRARPAKPDPAP